MIFGIIPYEKFVINSFFLCLGYWIVAFFLYLIRLFDENGFGKATKYGKLSLEPISTKEKEKKEESTFFLNRKFIETKNAWAFFYLLLSILSLIYLILISKIENHNLYNQKILYSMLIFQGLRRFYETIKIQNHRHSEMTLFLFISGCSYYVFLTSSIYFETLFKDINNSILEQTDSLDKRNLIKIIISVVLFLLNSFEQFKSHQILASLRSPSKDENGNQTNIVYSIPRGRLFNKVSSPHYFSEVLIYLSFLIISYFNYYSLILCFVFTAVNLLHRASETHEWYLTKFKENYSKLGRKIMIPGLI